MGALHEGHIRLIKHAISISDYVVCSIFVNPTQFNNPEDLKKYPRTIEQDLEMLKKAGCNLVYVPEVTDIYPENSINEPLDLDLGNLDKVMEGQFRPGHFKGVAKVVKRLFDIVNPDLAVFGRKDFQQTAVIKKLVQSFNMPIEIVIHETIRSDKGLALSSRNQRLSEQEKQDALIIYKTLEMGKELARIERNVEKLKNRMISFFESGNLQLEYLEIVKDFDLTVPSEISKEPVTCCIAAFCGEVRLIDNMALN